ncbi:YfhO family protein [Butyrivibrio sp. WCD3002]|uniref:YfhO family protein n=1 Tax=Butyrivibrio sp. WCD3002 TaxID=1280676 RepID=UPI00041062DE|nr:YfhO family protein [Butyrivibrio sp. WCD3002]
MNKHKAFTKEVMTGCMAALVTVSVFMAICFLERIAPFGDKTFLYLDMKLQYVDFYSYYKAVFHGQDGFLWSENCGLGSNMTGIWTYYLTSPFLIPFIFISEKAMPVAITFLLCEKMTAAAFFMGILLEYISEAVMDSNLNGEDKATSAIAKTAFAVAYAFSGWMVSNMTNTMWVDAAAVLPIVFLFYLKLLKDEKHGKTFYVLSVMLAFFLNYYIAAMYLLFMGVFTIIITLTGIIDAGRLGRFIRLSFVAGVLDLWFLVPVALALKGSNKDHSAGLSVAFKNILPSSEAVGKNISPLNVVSKFFTMSYDTIEIMDGFPNIYIGTALFVLVILFFFNRKAELKKRIAALTFLVFMVAVFCLDVLNRLAHFGTEAYGYLYRYSVIFSFSCLILGFLCICLWDGITAGGAFISGFIAEVLLLSVYLLPVRFITFRVFAINTAIIVLITGATILQRTCKEKMMLKRAVATMTFMVLLAELSLNFIWIYRSQALNAISRTEYINRIKGIHAALETIDENEKIMTGTDEDEYRTEAYFSRTANDGIHFGYDSVSTYNSLLKVEDRVLLFRMGFNDNGLYAEYANGNTRLADELLGIKYIITDGNVLPGEGQKAVSDNVLMNEKELPPDEYIREDDVKECLEYVEDECSDPGNPFEVQKLLYEKLTGRSDKFFEEADVVIKNDEEGVSLNITAREDGQLYFYMDRDKVTERSLELYLDGEFLAGYGNASSQKVINLGYLNKGDKCNLFIKTDALGELPAAPIAVTEIYSN